VVGPGARPRLIALAAAAITIALAVPDATFGRATSDRVDDIAGKQVHVVYALPSNGRDRRLDTSGALAASVDSFQRWLGGQTGGRRFRIDTYKGSPDVSFARLPATGRKLAAEGDFIRDAIERLLIKAGFVDPEKVYAVYYDGTARGSCGSGAWPPELKGTVAAEYLRGDADDPGLCESIPLAAPGGPPGDWEYGMAHEIVHTLGFVPRCAPHHVLDGHVSDSPTDLMYSGDQPWSPSTLDVGRDDYYGAGIPGCRDLSQSAFLTGGGDAVCRVPSVVGQSLARARAALVKQRCTQGRVTSRRAATRIGQVVSQSARPGATGPANARVSLTVLVRR
jgi:hypothetical protein